MSARRALTDVRAPDERGAEERAWSTVRTAYRDLPLPAPRRSRVRLAIVPLMTVLIGAAALSPAGATVGRIIHRALSVPGATSTAGLSLPAPGALLVSGRDGTWTVSRSGAVRRLGPWRQASWSPRGRYVAVTSASQLVVVDSRGRVAWRLARRGVIDPEWYAPSGYRIAYLAGGQLRVIAGDGSGDRPLATGVAAVAPAWRPAHPYQVAYVTDRGAVVVSDATTATEIWNVGAVRGRPLALAWSAGGTRLRVVTSAGVWQYARSDAAGQALALTGAGPVIAAAASPDGSRLALTRGGATPRVQVADMTSRQPVFRPVLSGIDVRQLSWAPGGDWLLVTWPAADQWLFVHVSGTPRLQAASRVTERFRAGGAKPSLPRIDGWCCPAGSPMPPQPG
jgi:hypothetical protein